jgi:hypothetical protein
LLDFQVLVREPDDPLDELTVWVSGEVKDNDVTTLRRVEPIGDLADDQVLAIVHIWLHAGSLDAKVLDEGADQKEDEQGEDHCFTVSMVSRRRDLTPCHLLTESSVVSSISWSRGSLSRLAKLFCPPWLD